MDGGDSFNFASQIWGKEKRKKRNRKKNPKKTLKKKSKKSQSPPNSYGRICTAVLDCLIIFFKKSGP